MDTSDTHPERGFRPADRFAAERTDYRILPFRFMHWNEVETILVNDVGEYVFLPRSEFRSFVSRALPLPPDAYRALKSKHFLTDFHSSVPVDLLATKYRTKKSFLEGFVKLHLFVVTLRCEHTCKYCQVSRVTENRTRFDMSRETAERAVDLMFQCPAPYLKVEFQGGESLLNFERIQQIVELVEHRNARDGRNIEFVIATNLVPLTDAMLTFMQEHSIFLSTSLDGPPAIHNANRPRPGRDSYEIAVRNIERVREALGPDRIAAIMTTTARSLEQPEGIVDEYVRQGFDSIFLRPMSPYGFAVRTGKAGEYDARDFVDFYKRALRHIVELNRDGTRFLEVYAQILLRRMLTPFATGYVDLQSPTGAGTGAVVYNYDGDVYASDEARMLAEMGDRSFRLGNVYRNSYQEIFGGAVVRGLLEASCVETLPGCADCAFAPYCGADPVFHWATQGDPIGHRPTSAFCTKNMALIRHLFELFRSGDEFIERLFISWATEQDRRVPA